MAYEAKDNSGALFKNDKQGNEKRPDYTGDCLINGVPLRVSAWIKEGAKGKFMSLSFQPKQDKPAQKDDFAKTFEAAGDMSDIPF